jgi:hypothetical protein
MVHGDPARAIDEDAHEPSPVRHLRVDQFEPQAPDRGLDDARESFHASVLTPETKNGPKPIVFARLPSRAQKLLKFNRISP